MYIDVCKVEPAAGQKLSGPQAKNIRSGPQAEKILAGRRPKICGGFLCVVFVFSVFFLFLMKNTLYG